MNKWLCDFTDSFTLDQVSNIQPATQNHLTKRSNAAHTMTLENLNILNKRA